MLGYVSLELSRFSGCHPGLGSNSDVLMLSYIVSSVYGFGPRVVLKGSGFCP